MVPQTVEMWRHRLNRSERRVARLVVVVRSVQGGRGTAAVPHGRRPHRQVLHGLCVPLVRLQIRRRLQPKVVLHLVVVLRLLRMLLLVVGGLLLLLLLLLLKDLRQSASHRIRTHFGPVRSIAQSSGHIGELGVHVAHGHPIGHPDTTDGRSTRPVGRDWWPLVRSFRVLLHVLGEIGLLGVRLAAVLADVRLEVLRLAVLGDVLQEGGLVRKALVAGVALEGLVSLVAPRVGLQVGQLGEGLQAARVAALVGFIAWKEGRK